MKIAIQAVPCRKSMVEMLVKRLPDGVAVFYDNDYNGPLWSLEKIFELYGDNDGLLVLQDDTIVPRWFMREFEASLIDGEVMSYFRGITTQQRELYDQGFSYAECSGVWGLANYYPSSFVKHYLGWAANNPNRGKRNEKSTKLADDLSISACLKEMGKKAYVTLPNLVNHQEAPSTMGNPRTVRGINRLSSLYGESLLRTWDKTKIGKLK